MTMRRKSFSFAVFQCALLFFAIAGCTKFEPTSASAKPTSQSAEECVDSIEDEIRFQWDWCAPNAAAPGEITTVCRGTLFFQDMIFEAIKFENDASSRRQCLFNIDGGASVSRPECTRAVAAKYFPMYDDGIETLVNECVGTDSKATVDGTVWNSSFHATQP